MYIFDTTHKRLRIHYNKYINVNVLIPLEKLRRRQISG